MKINAQYTSFVAVGDSFTEGMSDGLPDGSYRGWADLLAARLAARLRDADAQAPGFRYANLAVRGKLIGQILDEQCGPAASMGADLVTMVGGLNDVLRPKCDVDQVCAQFAAAAELLAKGGGQLVLMRSPGRQGPVLERFRPRMEQLFAQIDTVAQRHGAMVVDLYASRALSDQRLWADDRLHLNAEGHRRVAEARLAGTRPRCRVRLGPAARPGRTAGLGCAAGRRSAVHPRISGAVDRAPAHRPLVGRRPAGQAPRPAAVRGVTGRRASARTGCAAWRKAQPGPGRWPA